MQTTTEKARESVSGAVALGKTEEYKDSDALGEVRKSVPYRKFRKSPVTQAFQAAVLAALAAVAAKAAVSKQSECPPPREVSVAIARPLAVRTLLLLLSPGPLPTVSASQAEVARALDAWAKHVRGCLCWPTEHTPREAFRVAMATQGRWCRAGLALREDLLNAIAWAQAADEIASLRSDPRRMPIAARAELALAVAGGAR